MLAYARTLTTSVTSYVVRVEILGVLVNAVKGTVCATQPQLKEYKQDTVQQSAETNNSATISITSCQDYTYQLLQHLQHLLWIGLLAPSCMLSIPVLIIFHYVQKLDLHDARGTRLSSPMCKR